ncbi:MULTISPECIES: hypothetical protein [unclassified Streptomyces]|uniref:hypothetical protein n=1 Tax=unclassified Streptomyces TaxID=2593676 RepID=UPI000AD8116F|nr:MULTISPECIES: hypothetical protein [unclassified Streptomyces]
MATATHTVTAADSRGVPLFIQEVTPLQIDDVCQQLRAEYRPALGEALRISVEPIRCTH